METELSYLTIRHWWKEYINIIKGIGIPANYNDERSNKLMEKISNMTEEEKKILIDSLSWRTKRTARHENEN